MNCSHTALQYKRLSSVMNRVADTHPEKQGSKPSRASFFFNGSILMGLLHHQFIVLWQLKSVWRNNFSEPGTIILKVNFLCFNGTRKHLLIHGFSPVNARLLTVYGTAFYAITYVKIFILKVKTKEAKTKTKDHQKMMILIKLYINNTYGNMKIWNFL